MQIMAQLRAIDVLQDSIEDYDITIGQFRELVGNLQRYDPNHYSMQGAWSDFFFPIAANLMLPGNRASHIRSNHKTRQLKLQLPWRSI